MSEIHKENAQKAERERDEILKGVSRRKELNGIGDKVMDILDVVPNMFKAMPRKLDAMLAVIEDASKTPAKLELHNVKKLFEEQPREDAEDIMNLFSRIFVFLDKPLPIYDAKSLVPERLKAGVETIASLPLNDFKRCAALLRRSLRHLQLGRQGKVISFEDLIALLLTRPWRSLLPPGFVFTSEDWLRERWNSQKEQEETRWPQENCQKEEPSQYLFASGMERAVFGSVLARSSHIPHDEVKGEVVSMEPFNGGVPWAEAPRILQHTHQPVLLTTSEGGRLALRARCTLAIACRATALLVVDKGVEDCVMSLVGYSNIPVLRISPNDAMCIQQAVASQGEPRKVMSILHGTCREADISNIYHGCMRGGSGDLDMVLLLDQVWFRFGHRLPYLIGASSIQRLLALTRRLDRGKSIRERSSYEHVKELLSKRPFLNLLPKALRLEMNPPPQMTEEERFLSGAKTLPEMDVETTLKTPGREIAPGILTSTITPLVFVDIGRKLMQRSRVVVNTPNAVAHIMAQVFMASGRPLAYTEGFVQKGDRLRFVSLIARGFNSIHDRDLNPDI